MRRFTTLLRQLLPKTIIILEAAVEIIIPVAELAVEQMPVR